MKKLTSLLTVLCVILSMAVPSFGAVGVIRSGIAMVSIRGVFDDLGFNVTWDSESATATLSDSAYTVEIPKGKNYFMVNGNSIKPDTPQQVINGSLYIPLRAISESIGAEVSWNAEKKMAHISYNGNDSYVMCASESAAAATATKAKSASSSTSSGKQAVATQSNSPTVYIGETGNKYHTSSCRTLKNGAHPISLSEALAEGRTACKVCKP